MKCEKCNSNLSIPITPGMDKIYKNFSVQPRYYCKSCKIKDKRYLTDEDMITWKKLNNIRD